jgi:hypothetical protein
MAAPAPPSWPRSPRSPPGRVEVAGELQLAPTAPSALLEDAESVLQRAAKALDALMNHIREKCGITDEAIAKVVAEVPTDLK